jgi:hypothetical protein
MVNLEEEQYGEFMGTSGTRSDRLHEYVTAGRWTGRAVVLWADGAPG